ncbi:Chondroitin polymerase [Jannaschia seosinensis]|uniref:Chondroitin polymerase n=1 Tax=Jannaschia seosinensis TaxID=313367 RepID=A0A0M7BHP4_9RHOB|nr:glycosyltransferase [Jannaschia seosinensis]CUH40866.1 Chondroitin polymerase [Jannaschia seosinensis]
MSLQDFSIEAGVFSSRNHWHRLEEAMRALARDEPARAWKMLEEIRLSEKVGPEVLEAARRLVGGGLARAGGARIDLPCDYLRSQPGKRFQSKLRQIRDLKERLRQFPSDLFLPRITGNANDFSFLVDASWSHGFWEPLPALRLRLVVEIDGPADLARLERSLAAYRRSAPALTARLSLCISAPEALHGTPLPVPADWIAVPAFALDSAAQMRHFAKDTEIVCFAPLPMLDDGLVLERVVRYVALSGRLCLVLCPFGALCRDNDPEALPTLLSDRMMLPAWTERLDAFCEVRGMAFALDVGLFRETGGFNSRFATPGPAATHLAWRISEAGAYFLPLSVRAEFVTAPPDPEAPRADTALLRQLCPHPAIRHSAGRFEVPRVSIYIPAYRAARYLKAAIDSALEQDYEDLEVCVADDGSPDATLEVLRGYDGDPRVRYVSGPNGGIGHASNRAINMARGAYIGQLDSDDRLKPGAVRRLAEYLDTHPLTGCVYGSCERIDENGYVIGNEYSHLIFSRKKMLTTSIVHHFRMFRRQSWERTGKFREDIVNAVDYDMFLKLSEVTAFHHVNEILYQRRWHGENTSRVNETFQTTNTYAVQRQALERMGLERFWEGYVPDPERPRAISYRRGKCPDRVYFWPDYSRTNLYQRLLYAPASEQIEFVGGSIDEALQAIGGRAGEDAGAFVFHLHWLNKVFAGAATIEAAARAAHDFLDKLRRFRFLGGRIVWTIHNTLSHDLPFRRLERNLSREVLDLADAVHVHCQGSIPDIEANFPLPHKKLHVARHGAYVGAYPDFITRAQARDELRIEPDEEVILFLGQIRPYKGLDALLAAFREILPRRPRARLVIAGSRPIAQMLDGADLSDEERARITIANRFIDEMELQVFFRAADLAVFPYTQILTSGSFLLSLSFGVPAIVPEGAMTREVLKADVRAGRLYSPGDGLPALVAAIEETLGRIAAGEDHDMKRAARRVAEALEWEDITQLLLGRETTRDKEVRI